MTDSDNDSDKIDIEKDKRELDVPNQTQPPSGKFRESDAGDGTVREDHILTGMRFYMCAISLLLCLFLVALDQMITAAVLTTISDHFNEFNKMTWIFSAFMTPLGCCAQVWARLSISFGRKWIMLSGVILFELGSLIAGVSNSMNMFIGGRAIQGIGGSAIQSCVMIIATEITTIDKKPLLFASLSITYVVASVIGPLVGGTFGSYVTWRWCFYLNLCCGAVILPFFVFTYRPKPPVGSFMKKLKTVDWLDNFLMIAACVLILLGISFGQTEPSWKTASTICCFVLGGLLLIAFLVYNFKFSKYPTLPGDIVAKPAILMAFGTFSLNYSVLMVLAQFLSIYVQNVLGFDSFRSGLFILPCAIASGFTAIMTGITMRKIRYIKPFCLVAGVILPISVGLMMLLGVKENLGYIIGFEILLGISTGFNFQGPMMSALVNAPKTPGSSILTTAYMNFGRSMTTALFSEIGSAIYASSLKSGIERIAPQLQETEYPIEQVMLQTELIKQLDGHDRALVFGKMMTAFYNVFWMCVGMSLVSLVFAVFMSKKKIPKGEDVEA